MKGYIFIYRDLMKRRQHIQRSQIIKHVLVLKRTGRFVLYNGLRVINYLELVYLVTALVPSETACLANSPGRRSLTAVWISREVMVDLLL